MQDPSSRLADATPPKEEAAPAGAQGQLSLSDDDGTRPCVAGPLGPGRRCSDLVEPAAKRRRVQRQKVPRAIRQLDFQDFEIHYFQKYASDLRRSCRHKIPRLEHWKGEGLVYERKEGSLMPTVAAVRLALDDTEQPLGPEPIMPAVPSQPVEPAQPVVPLPDDVLVELPASPPQKEKEKAVEASSKILRAHSSGRSSRHAPFAPQRRRSTGKMRAAPMAATPAAVATPRVTPKPKPVTSSFRAPRRGLPQDQFETPPPIANPATTVPDYIFRPDEDTQGFMELGRAEGSLYSCYYRSTVDQETRAAVTGDVIVPISSSSPIEMVQRSLVIQVLRADEGALTVEVDGKVLETGPGSIVCVKEQQKYCIRNCSSAASAHLKVTMLKV